MSKIPTAEEFIIKEYELDNSESHYNNLLNDDVYEVMVEFAKAHVKAALKEALESIPCLGSSTDIATYDEIEHAVLNSYPLDNIK